MLQLPHPAPTNRQALLHLSLTPFFSSDAFYLSLLHTSPSLSGVRRPACLGMVVVSRLRTAPRLHFICPLLSPAAARSNTLLFSNKTLSQLTLYPPPSERPDCSWTVTRDSQPTHTPAKPTVCRYGYKTLLFSIL